MADYIANANWQGEAALARQEAGISWLTGPGALTLTGPAEGLLVQLTDSFEITPEQQQAEGEAWPSQSGCVTAWTAPERNQPAGQVTVTLSGAVTGEIYNATGYRDHAPQALTVQLGKGAVFTGAISATESRFTPQGVCHQTFMNGGNEVAVTLSDGAVWEVEGAGYLTALTVNKGCRFTGMVLVDDRMVSLQKGKTLEGLILVLPG